MLFTSEEAGTFARKIGLQFGTDFDARGAKLEDHVLNESNPNVVKTSRVAAHSVFTIPNSKEKGILFEGIMQTLSPRHAIEPLLVS